MTARSIHKEGGFTLIEVLLALFIFSLISAGSALALSSSLRGKAQVEARLSDLQAVSMARALITADMDNVILRPRRDILGGQEPTLLSGGVDNLLDFTRVGRINPGGIERRGDLQAVSYHFEDGQLIRRALSQVNPAPDTAVVDRVLLSGLADADIDFFRAEQDFPLAQIEITEASDTALTAIRLRAEFKNGDVLTQDFEVRL